MRKTRILAAILSFIVLFTTVFTGDFVVNAEEAPGSITGEMYVDGSYYVAGDAMSEYSDISVPRGCTLRIEKAISVLNSISIDKDARIEVTGDGAVACGAINVIAEGEGNSPELNFESARNVPNVGDNALVLYENHIDEQTHENSIVAMNYSDWQWCNFRYDFEMQKWVRFDPYDEFGPSQEGERIVELALVGYDRQGVFPIAFNGVSAENEMDGWNRMKARVSGDSVTISWSADDSAKPLQICVEGAGEERENGERDWLIANILEGQLAYTINLNITGRDFYYVEVKYSLDNGGEGGQGGSTHDINVNLVSDLSGYADDSTRFGFDISAYLGTEEGVGAKIEGTDNHTDFDKKNPNGNLTAHLPDDAVFMGFRVSAAGQKVESASYTIGDSRHELSDGEINDLISDGGYTFPVVNNGTWVEAVTFNIRIVPGGDPNPGGDDNIEVYFPGDVSISGNVITYQVDNKKVTLTVSGASVENNKIKIPRNNIDNVTFTVGENYDHDKMEVNLRDSQGFYLPLIVNEEGITKLTAFEGDHGIPGSFVLNIEDKHNDGPGPGPEPASDGIQFQVKGPDRGTVSYKIGDSSYTLANLDELQSSDQNSETYHFDEDTTVVFSVVPKNSTTEFSVHINCSDQNENVGQEMDKKYERGFMDQLAQGREVSFVAKAGMMYTITVEFGQQEMPWYTVSWAGGNVTVENGEVIAERVYIPAHDGEPAKVYTINVDEVDEAKGVYYLWDTIGKQKEKEEDPDSLELYGLGFSQSDLFIRNGLEGISIDFKFIPKYGYQLKDIYTNENHTEESCLNDFKTNDDNISTFTFDVRPGQNVHFQVYFKQSEDVISTEGATNISDAAIADGGNATSSGNLSLNVKDASKDSNVANAVSTFDVTLDNIVSKGGENGNWVSNITEFEDPITLTLDLDTTVYTSDSYTVVREHDGTYETLEATYDKATGELVFETNKFSTYTIVEKAYNVVGYQLVVDSNLDLKLTVDISDEIKADENSCIVFTVDGKEQRVKYSAIAGSFATYICEVPSKCIADNIVAKLYFNEKYYELPDFSIKNYLEYLIKNPENIADYAYAKDIAEAILTYGAYSQIYFGYNTDKLANEKLATNPVEEMTDEDVKSAISISEKIVENDDFGFLGASLVCNSDTFIRIYLINKKNLSLDEIKEKYDFYVAGGSNPITDISVAEGTVCLELQNIPAAELDNIYIFMLEGVDTEVMIKYSPYNYISMAMDEGSENLKNLCKALYLYSIAANDYYNRYSVPA